MQDIKALSINTVRILAADSIQKANSGHPGLPLGAAPALYTLFGEVMTHNPKNPEFRERDRFILSAGHGSALLYSLLHIFGYGVSADDLRNFRQFGSSTPGHPEFGHTPGVEVTTGPLGQGIANAVGMAMAEKHLAGVFNKADCKLVDHYTYVLCGDGCLEEGVSGEASSLAGTLGLGKLILLYDSNNITIEGDTALAFTENVIKRYDAYGWHTELVEDGNDTGAILEAINRAKSVGDKPSIIEIKTKIGFGSPNKQGKASAHGEPLGADELKLTKQAFGFDPEQCFVVPQEVYERVKELQVKFSEKEETYNKLKLEYAAKYPEDYALYESFFSGELPDIFEKEDFWKYEGNTATRVSSETVLNKLCGVIPNLFGGSADLSPSTKTYMKGQGDFSKQTPEGRNVHFGIREFAMTAIANGIYRHGGLRPYISGFFVFSDYMKPAMRLSALMNLPVINILTHDSIGVGEDGPTHEPIEQLAALRSMPNMTVLRPCDSKETAAAWYLALTRTKSPSVLVLTRQNTTLLPETGKDSLKGGYILIDSKKSVPDMILLASGSETELIYKAHGELLRKGIDSRVVSMMSFEVFEEQPDDYKQSVLPSNVRKRLAVEAGSSFGWHKYTGLDGEIIAIDTFGASAPAATLFAEFGFTVENVVKRAEELYAR